MPHNIFWILGVLILNPSFLINSEMDWHKCDEDV